MEITRASLPVSRFGETWIPRSISQSLPAAAGISILFQLYFLFGSYLLLDTDYLILQNELIYTYFCSN
jgi:hypothetical protein